ncbi:membrane protein [Brevibacillus panacihumi W25]|uniref:Membrane protein n=2 Tax=Brevibacillus panacihumi TaxID=497735 RepID=V6MAC0_9BACL|nr:multidrug efflux SMR transporter [Brevibacillus panacihumi]EST55511.1 membrane protein [Brevibacillus panacihumi W25]RNB74735.1 multidrug efflux SMR transporter [Brevibacillus panacihumi]
MAWILLILAGLEEVVAVVAMKHIDGLKRKTPLVVMTLGLAFSIYCLTQAMREIPASVAYAVWTGIGSVGITTLGYVWFKEKLSKGQVASLAILVLSVVALRVTS